MAGCSGESEPFEKKSFTPDTQVNGINLDVRDREIEVTLSDDEQVHIQYSENSKEYYEISVSDGNVLTMVNASNKDRRTPLVHGAAKYFGMRIGIKTLISRRLFVLRAYGITGRLLMILDKI